MTRATPLLLILLWACATPAASDAPLCALDGTCPAGMACAGAVCEPIGDGVQVRWQPDTLSAGADVTDSQSSGAVDGGPTKGDTQNGGEVDAGLPQDSKQTTDADTKGADTTGGDTLDGGATADATSGVTVASLQQNSPCATPSGSAAKSPATLDGVVVTGAPIKSGKYPVFFVRDPNVGQDPAWQGLKVFVFGGPTSVKAGDVVRLDGELTEFYCETQLTVQAAAIVQKSQTAPPDAFAVSTAQLTNESKSTEELEGVWVELTDVVVFEPNVVGTDGKTHGEFAVRKSDLSGPLVIIGPTSGTTFSTKSATTDQFVSKWSAGQKFKRIRGHLHYSFGRYILRPPTDADVETK